MHKDTCQQAGDYLLAPIRRQPNASWINLDTNELVNMDANWALGQPNGQNLQECITYDLKNGVFYDEECSRKQCFACSWDHQPAFVLRGLCATTKIEKHYILLPEKGGFYPFFCRLYK